MQGRGFWAVFLGAWLICLTLLFWLVVKIMREYEAWLS